MINLKLPKSAAERLRVLCLGAHSDDIEIGCGGTLLQLQNTYDRVIFDWVILSASGVRGEEAARSAQSFAGRNEIHILLKEFRDGFFPYVGGVVKEVFEELKQRTNPDLIFTHCSGDAHQDHRLVSELTWNTFRNHLILEYEIPKYDADLGRPNVFVPLASEECEKKVEFILGSFESQRAKQWFDRDTFMGLMRIRGMESNSPTRYAEAFYGRKLVLGTEEPG